MERKILEIIDNITYDNTLTYLEEQGYISLDQVEYDIDNFIESLEKEIYSIIKEKEILK